MRNKDAIHTFLGFGQESRLNVFCLVVHWGAFGHTPTEMIENLGISNATLFPHLKGLFKAKLLLVGRQSQNLIYRLNAQIIESLSEFLIEKCCRGRAV